MDTEVTYMFGKYAAANYCTEAIIEKVQTSFFLYLLMYLYPAYHPSATLYTFTHNLLHPESQSAKNNSAAR